MQLRRLVSLNELEYSDVICFGGTERYIRQFEELSNGLCRIRAVVSINTNHPKAVVIGGTAVPCVSMSEAKGYENNCSLIIMDDYYREYYNALCSGGIYSAETVWWLADNETAIELSYREKYKQSDLENIIVFRSGPHATEYVKGMDFSDNARALFEYLLSIEADRNYLMVWIVKDPGDYESKYTGRNVEFVSWEWAYSENLDLQEKYYRPLCLAKLIFFTDAYGFARNARKDQVRVQLWHGVGFKSRVNFVRCENRYEYKIDTGPVFAEKSVELYGLRSDQVKILGYPKIDWLFQKDDRNLLSILGIRRTKKLIVWAPTFRKTGGVFKDLDMRDSCFEECLPILDKESTLREFNEVLNRRDVMLVIKLHPFQDESCFKDANYSNILTISSETLCKYDIQMNQFLKYADALISDYSSTATEYMQLDRPIAFIINDKEDYSAERKFAFEQIEEWLPGDILESYEDLVNFIIGVSNGKDVSAEKRHSLFPQMHSFKGEGSSRRVAVEFGII